MRKIFLTLLSIVLLLAAREGHAQSPPGINYQGIARNPDGKPLSQKNITIRINILKEGGNGDVEYAEVHSVTTNSFGLFTLVIGTGHVETGDFGFITWGVGSKWLRVEMDSDGGSSFQIMGSQQFMSVPYAFYAKHAGSTLMAGQGIAINNNVVQNTGDADANPANELNTGLALGTDHVLRLTDAGGIHEADLSSLIPPGSNPQDLLLTGDKLTITDKISPTEIDLGPYRDNTDAQDLSSSATGTNRTISITGGSPTTIDVADNDNSSTNEIQNLASLVAGTNRTISITGGASTTIDVADNDNNATNEIQNLASLAAGTNRTISIVVEAPPVIDIDRCG